MFEFTLILLSLFVLWGLWYFVWIGLDWYDVHTHHRKQMSMPHYHHVLLGLWPFFTAYLTLFFFNQAPELAIHIFVVLTCLLYFFLARWDSHYQKVHLDSLHLLDPYTSSPLLFRIAGRLPDMTAIFFSFVLFTEAASIINNVFVVPQPLVGSTAIFIWVGIILVLYRVRKKW